MPFNPKAKIGTTVAARYAIDGILGHGGMGVVFSATHTWTERPVALKMLAPELADEPDLLERFFAEAKAVAQLRHPNVVDVLDMGEDDDGASFLVFEKLEGETLSARLARAPGGRLEVADALRLVAPIIRALIAAHGKGIVHRDLKPDNIFLARGADGFVIPKLLDFGVAKLLESDIGRTITGTVMGTPTYMAPEQIQAIADVDGRADVWSIGVLLFRSLSGRLPTEPQANPTQTLMRILSQDPPRLALVASEIPTAIAAVVDGALERDRAARHPSMQVLFDRLVEAAEGADLDVDPRISKPPGGV